MKFTHLKINNIVLKLYLKERSVYCPIICYWNSFFIVQLVFVGKCLKKFQNFSKSNI